MNTISCLLDFHPDAITEFGQAYIWYEMKETGLGEKFQRLVRQKLEQIVEMPEAFSLKSKKNISAVLIEVSYLTIRTQ